METELFFELAMLCAVAVIAGATLVIAAFADAKPRRRRR
jgi:hypothetical protein